MAMLSVVFPGPRVSSRGRTLTSSLTPRPLLSPPWRQAQFRSRWRLIRWSPLILSAAPRRPLKGPCAEMDCLSWANLAMMVRLTDSTVSAQPTAAEPKTSRWKLTTQHHCRRSTVNSTRELWQTSFRPRVRLCACQSSINVSKWAAYRTTRSPLAVRPYSSAALTWAKLPTSLTTSEKSTNNTCKLTYWRGRSLARMAPLAR